jgi:hypothetical protein
MEVTQIVILVVLLYALYVICNVENKKKVDEGFGNVTGNSNYVVYGNVSAKNLKNGGVELSNGKVYDNQDYFDYTQTVLNQGKNDVVFYNDVLDQTKVNESSTDIEYGIDTIDFSQITTGMDKCKKNCDGECVTYGYDSVATCFPRNYSQTFDYGSLLRNPAFTLGISDNN